MRALRIGLAVLGALLVLIVVATFIFIRSFDPNAYKGELTEYVEQRTGRRLTIADDIELALLPWLAIETGGLTLSDDSRFGDHSLVTIDKLSGRVRVWPLLRRRVEIGRIILDGVDLTLGIDADGRGNWQVLTEGEPGAAAGTAMESDAGGITAAAGARLPAVERLAVEAIELRNSRIVWRDFATDENRYLISELNLETGRIDDEAPVDVDMTFGVTDLGTERTADIAFRSIVSRSPGVALSDTEARFAIREPNGDEQATAVVHLQRVAIDASRAVTAAGLEAELQWARPQRDPLEVALAASSIDFDPATRALALRGLVTRAGELTAEWILDVRQPGIASTGEAEGIPILNATVDAHSPSLQTLFDTLGLSWPASLADDDGGPFQVAARFELTLDPLAIRLDDATATALGVAVEASAALAEKRLSVDLAVPSFAPRAPLLAWLQPQLPAGVDLTAIASAGLTGAFTHTLGSDRLAVDQLSVTLDAARIGTSFVLTGLDEPSHITGTIAASDLDNTLVAALFGAWLPADLRAADIGRFRLDTHFDHATRAGRTEFDMLALEAYGLAARGRLAIVDSNGDLTLEGRAEIDPFSPRSLLARFDLPIPESRDPTSLSRARVSADFRTTGSSGNFRNIVLTLDDSIITGELGVENFADPGYRFDLHADRIDVDRYLPPNADETEAGDRQLGDMELATEPLTATRISGIARVDELGIAGLQLQQVTTQLDVGDGRGRLDPVSASLYGGTFAGRLAVDADGNGSKTTALAGNLRDVSLAPLLTALLGDSHLSGTGSIELDLTGTGDTVDDVLETAAGSMNVSLVRGQVAGFNLERTLCAAFNALDGSPAPPGAQDITTVAEMRTDAVVANGVASTANLFASTGSVSVTGTGDMRLTDRHLDFALRARLDNRIALDRCDRINSQVGNSFPFTLDGTLPNVRVLPDLAQYIQDRATQRIRESVEDRILESIRDRLR